MRNFLPIVLIVVLAAVALVIMFFFAPSKNNFFARPSITPSTVHADAQYTGSLDKEYKNAKYLFSVMMPDDFTATEVPSGADTTSLLLQNKTGDGVQINISPFPEDLKVLTAERITEEIPNMQISNVEEVEIGPEYKGVAFKSNNEAFGGDSREVWFVFRGTLYQISTYARLDPLMKAMFATWKFY